LHLETSGNHGFPAFGSLSAIPLDHFALWIFRLARTSAPNGLHITRASTFWSWRLWIDGIDGWEETTHDFSVFALPRRQGGVAQMHDTTRPGISLHWNRSVDVDLHGFYLPRMAPLLAVRTRRQDCLPAMDLHIATNAQAGYNFYLDPNNGFPLPTTGLGHGRTAKVSEHPEWLYISC
jgi:hypothetical protein